MAGSAPEDEGGEDCGLADSDALRRRLEASHARNPDPARFRAEAAGLLRAARDEGMQQIRRDFLAASDGGLVAARRVAGLTDAVVRLAHDAATRLLHPSRPGRDEDGFAIVAVGGYGRGEMAPFSDVDLLFLTAPKTGERTRRAIETILHLLWDMRLKVGSAVRDVASCLQLGQEDRTVATTLLDMRRICGPAGRVAELEPAVFDGLFRKGGRGFVEAKLAERDRRHEIAGGSRYLLSPDIKDGKGGFRDLQTLYWLAGCLFGSTHLDDFVRRGILDPEEAAALAEAERNLWTWRFHLHFAAGRAEERLHFEHQERLARALGYREADGLRPVERFMREYYRTARSVGDLTRIFCAALEEREEKAPPLRGRVMAWFGRGPAGAADGAAGAAGIEGFRIRNGRLAFPGAGRGLEDPADMMRIFHASHRLEMDIHPEADRVIVHNAHRIDDRLRADPGVNRLFLEILTSRRNPIRSLRRMSETGVLGRFLPEFEHVIGLMQFDLYHHYTVDEHTLKTIEMLALIEEGDRGGAHPLATSLIGSIRQRRALYVALLLHDIGKGLGGDHASIGAEIAARLCPRLGLDEAESETVVWLVRYHLLLNSTAQRRDLADPATIRSVAEIVQERERLAQLLILTVCDMTSVAPDYWNEWKAQLLRDLHQATLSLLTSGQGARDSERRAAEARERVRPLLPDPPPEPVQRFLDSFGPTFWIGLDAETIRDVATLAGSRRTGRPAIRVAADPHRRAVKVCVCTDDRPALLADLAGEISAAGFSVVEVRSYLSKDVVSALVFWMQPALPGTRLDPAGFRSIQDRLRRAITSRRVSPTPARPQRAAAAEGLRVPIRIRIDNQASDLHTLIEVAAGDRPGLLADLTRVMHAANAHVASAVVTTYGARAVDSFYVKNAYGLKIMGAATLRDIETRLHAAAEARADGPA